MTEENQSSPVRHLDSEDIRLLHTALAEWSLQHGDEPVPPITPTAARAIEALAWIPKQQFEGKELYPSIEEKAAILFYSINKQQIFTNGNKRMSTLCLLVFLTINDRRLTVTDDELTAKALSLAQTSSMEFPRIKEELTGWIRDHLQNT